MTPSALCFSTFLASLLGSFLPFGSTELLVLSAAALAPPGVTILVALSAACGQMISKSVVYFAGRGLVHLPGGRVARATERVHARANVFRNTSKLLLFASATTGFPPFYVITIAAGTLRVPFARFLGIGLCGRIIRFAVLAGLPHALKAAL